MYPQYVRSYNTIDISGVQIQRSDFETRLSCIDLGITPRNNRVDFGNIYMNISGQPVHFFDQNKLVGKLSVRLAQNGEKFEDLMGTEHILQDQDIVITDEVNIVALAGIIGGANSSIDEHTTDICIEVANFDPVMLRRTATRLGLRTDAVSRYEKNINPLRTSHCVDDIYSYISGPYKSLLGDMTLGNISRYTVDRQQKEFDINISQLNKFIFAKDAVVNIDTVDNILSKLGFVSKIIDQNILHIYTPIRRTDISHIADIYEEFARIYGYDHIDPIDIYDHLQSHTLDPIVQIHRDIESTMIQDLRCDHIETYPRISQTQINILGISTDGLISLQNPVDSEYSYLRDRIYPSLLETVIKNHRFEDQIKIRDMSKTFEKLENMQDKLKESWKLSIVHYISKDILTDTLLGLQGSIRHLLHKLGISNTPTYKTSTLSIGHPNRQGYIYIGDTCIGYICQLHPMILDHYKLSTSSCVVIAELDISAILNIQGSTGCKQVYYSLTDQIINRDLSFIIDTKKSYGDIVSICTNIQSIIDVRVFDIYQIDADHKSISLTIYILGDGKMTTSDINNIMNQAISAVQSTGAILRDGSQNI